MYFDEMYLFDLLNRQIVLPLLLYYCLLLFLGLKDSSVTVSSISVVNKASHFKVRNHQSFCHQKIGKFKIILS